MEKLDTLFDLLGELLGEYSFGNHKRMVDIIRSAKADMEDSIVPHGNQYVLSRLQSYQSRLGQFDELTDGRSGRKIPAVGGYFVHQRKHPV
jgi:Zn-dependent M16 (insulinase) family peptidase